MYIDLSSLSQLSSSQDSQSWLFCFSTCSSTQIWLSEWKSIHLQDASGASRVHGFFDYGLLKHNYLERLAISLALLTQLSNQEAFHQGIRAPHNTCWREKITILGTRKRLCNIQFSSRGESSPVFEPALVLGQMPALPGCSTRDQDPGLRGWFWAARGVMAGGT